jgi:signal transduction histidine kinase
VARRHGLQSEVLLSLATVMLTATLVLAALLVKTHEASVRRLHPLAARALLEDARGPLPVAQSLVPELHWWTVVPGGRDHPRGTHSEPIDAGSKQLALEASRRGVPLLAAGFPWQSVRFAAPEGDQVLAARLPPAVPGAVVLAVLIAEGLISTAFGITLLRRRLVRPLQRLAGAARGLADGDLSVRAAAEGPRETWEVASVFNEMSEALETRTRALEKAVADLRQSNEQLRDARVELDRAERLAAVGSLAAGVAHEVGNPMGAMLGFVELAKRDAGLSEDGRSHLDRVLQEGQRVRAILRQLLDFSRPPRTERVAVDLVRLARETTELVRAQRRYAGVRIDVVSEGEPPDALADPAAVAQIVLNLLLNAVEALLTSPPLEPRVRVAVRIVPGRSRVGDVQGEAVRCGRIAAVECRVSDNGPGIPEADRERIFDPFYTTRDPGEGTGLGLSNALRFAEELGGRLTLEAGSGPGASFALQLPVAQDAGEEPVSVRGVRG